MSQKGRQERVRMRSERWWLLGGNLLTSLSMPLVLSPYIGPVLVVWLSFVSILRMHFVLLLSISILLFLLVNLMVLQCG